MKWNNKDGAGNAINSASVSQTGELMKHPAFVSRLKKFSLSRTEYVEHLLKTHYFNVGRNAPSFALSPLQTVYFDIKLQRRDCVSGFAICGRQASRIPAAFRHTTAVSSAVFRAIESSKWREICAPPVSSHGPIVLPFIYRAPYKDDIFNTTLSLNTAFTTNGARSWPGAGNRQSWHKMNGTTKLTPTHPHCAYPPPSLPTILPAMY